MRKQYIHILILLPALWMLAACQEESNGCGLWPDDNNLRLSGVSARQVEVGTRATATGFFPANTLYRVWAYGGAKDSEERKPVFNVTGYDFEQGGAHYIQLPPDTPLQFNPADGITALDFYSLTDLSAKKDGETITDEDDYLGMKDQKDAPVYILTKEAGKPLPDMRYAQEKTHQDDARYVIPLQFKHILSKVNFEIVQQEDEHTDEPLFGSLTLEKLTVSNQPATGTFDVKQGKFTELGKNTTTYAVTPDEESQYPVKIGTTPTQAGHVILFPMPKQPTDEAEALTVSILLGSNNRETLKIFTQNDELIKEVKADKKYTLPLSFPVYANPTPDDPHKLLQLQPNYEYTLQLMIMEDKMHIITIVPRVYEWIDGEKGNHTAEEGWHENQDLGQPITFNGVMWSDRNLGASSAHPLENIEEWRKSVGYYYQYDRNIPYFPNTYENEKVNLNTPLETALGGNKVDPLYPVVNYAAWGMDTYPTHAQLQPMDANSKHSQIVSKIGVLPLQQNNALFGYAHNNANIKTGLWKSEDTQPCPKGWRLPTQKDVYSIIPGSGFSGNITFRVFNYKNTSSGSWGIVENKRAKEPDFASAFSKDAIQNMKIYTSSYLTDEDITAYMKDTKVLYFGEFPCLYRKEADDPQPGATSEYVLSMHKDDWHMAMDGKYLYHVQSTGEYVYNYGVIYGLKNQGTDKAYRVKWELVLLGAHEETDIPESAKNHCIQVNTKQYEGKKGIKYTEGLKGVLKISRYTATREDSFAPQEGSYTWVPEKKEWWANPVEVMYLPICGGAGNWKEGRVFNIGTEGWYATSDEYENRKGIIWIKVMGDNAENQTIIYSERSPKEDAVNIRPVRVY